MRDRSLGRGDGFEPFEGPVVLIGGAFVDPAFENGHFGGGEPADLRFGLRHDFFGIIARDAENKFTLRAATGDD